MKPQTPFAPPGLVEATGAPSRTSLSAGVTLCRASTKQGSLSQRWTSDAAVDARYLRSP
jgi:hypothetical protein